MSNDGVQRISCEELKRMMDAGEKVVVIDTRESSEYSTGHIHGAVNIYYNILGDPQTRELMLSALPADILLVPYCDCIDDSTSASMGRELLGLRYDSDKVKALRGGLLNWKQLGYPVESG